MSRPALSVPARSLFIVLLGLCAACGGGGDSTAANPPTSGVTLLTVTSATPSQVSAEGATTVTLHGSGFGAAGAATVRLIAVGNTPFQNGTSDSVDVAATVQDDETIVFSSPAATVCSTEPVGLRVRVDLPDGSAVESTNPLLSLQPRVVVSASPSTVSARTPTSITLTGSGFGSAGASVPVTFTATSGTPFAGGTSAVATVQGSVVSDSTVQVVTPAAQGGFTAGVSVELPGGGCAASAAAIVTFEAGIPGPTVTSSAGADVFVSQGDRVSFDVTATDAQGHPVTLRLLNPPQGATFSAIVGGASPATARVEWTVGVEDETGLVPLVFRAIDATNAEASTMFVVRAHVEARTLATIRVGDVTGDGRADVVAAARDADLGSVSDAGALYVWAGATTPSGAPTATLTVSGAASMDRMTSGGFRLVDVTGDGTLDVVAAASTADGTAGADAGAIAVWKGGATLSGAKSADAVLVLGTGGALTGMASTPFLWNVGDVSGDGTADVVASAPYADVGAKDAGVVAVWKGGSSLTGTRTPDATLTATTVTASNVVGREGVVLADVTGDGTLDVIAAAPLMDVNGAVDAGALLVWKGGSALTGAKQADATLTSSTAANWQSLGLDQPVKGRVVDVDGDGTLDLLVAIPEATVGGTSYAGVILVWKGGSTLSGAKTEDAALTVSGATSGDLMGAGLRTRLLVGDVSGDGQADVIGVAPFADVSGVADAGAAYVWRGGSALSGSRTQDATLTVSGAVAGDQTGSGGVRLADVTGDGVLDVVASSPMADAGATNAGAVHVWAGGSSLSGAVTATAKLAAPSASVDAGLGDDPTRMTFAPRFADVSGDGTLDLIVPAVAADVLGLRDAGAVYVWNGGAALVGAPAASAVLTMATPGIDDRLGEASGAFVVAADVTGDGTADVISPAATVDVGTVTNAGAIAVWRGGSLAGARTPDALLTVSGARYDDRLAGGLLVGNAWDVVDLTADGVLDVVAVAPHADTATLSNVGAGYLWAGGSAMTGIRTQTATFATASASSGDQLGARGAIGDLMTFADVTGDGNLDLVLGSSRYTGTGTTGHGALFLWSGGALTGAPAATSVFEVSGALAGDHLGE